MRKSFLLAACVLLAVAPLSLFCADALPDAVGVESLRYWSPQPALIHPQTFTADMIIYGASPGGVTAAVQISRMGKKAIIAEFGNHVGGLTAGGLSATDVGNRSAIAGMANEFFDKVGMLRGFKPSAAEKVFRDMLKEAGVEVLFGQRLASVKLEGNRIAEIKMENGNVFRGKIFIDTSYEGDLMAMARVTYTYGREANKQYNETINGAQFHSGHNFTKPIDPYIIEGDPKSGLLALVSPAAPPKQGDGDKLIQAYNFRMYLNNSPDRIPFPKPKHYDPARYALLARYLQVNSKVPIQLHYGDCNNEGAFSSDNIGKNYDWPDADYAKREAIFQDHVSYQQGFMYFIGHDESVAKNIRDEVAKWGLTKGEFEGSGNWPHQLYIREARRMISDYVMTENDCMGRVTAADSIGLGSYNMDSHNCERIVIDGKVRNEGDVQIGPPRPYPISYRSIVPKEAECANLFVPVALSCTHISYGSIRMEPVFMILGQSAGTAAVMALDANVAVQKVDYSKLKERLIVDKQKLNWDAAARENGGQHPAGIQQNSLKGIVMDDAQAEKTGDWTSAHVTSGYVGEGYIHDGNADKGKKSVRFTIPIEKEGTYDVRMSYTALGNRASNVPVTVISGGQSHLRKINEKEKPPLENGFISLGKHHFIAGEKAIVEISNDGTDGHVIVDAVQLIAE